MRPTAIPLTSAIKYRCEQIVLIGGTEMRENWVYSIKQDKYFKLAKLPIGHNITTNVCVNFKNQAIFTFIHDARLTIKIAVLDLLNIDSNEEKESQKTMEWVLKMDQQQH